MHDGQIERHQVPNEAEHLLSEVEDSMEMADLSTQQTAEDNRSSHIESRYTGDERHAEASASRQVTRDGEEVPFASREQHIEYRVYKIRFFGLTQLILLNIVVSWDVSQ